MKIWSCHVENHHNYHTLHSEWFHYYCKLWGKILISNEFFLFFLKIIHFINVETDLRLRYAQGEVGYLPDSQDLVTFFFLTYGPLCRTYFSHNGLPSWNRMDCCMLFHPSPLVAHRGTLTSCCTSHNFTTMPNLPKDSWWTKANVHITPSPPSTTPCPLTL
jgi:hypothetical protein